MRRAQLIKDLFVFRNFDIAVYPEAVASYQNVIEEKLVRNVTSFLKKIHSIKKTLKSYEQLIGRKFNIFSS